MDARAEHRHSEYLCPAHVAGCNCVERASEMCNPYFRAGYCPDGDYAVPVVRATAEGTPSGLR